jgi:hypothetical protein
VSQCGPDEWCVVVEDPEVAEPDTSLPGADAPENLLCALCFRDSSEIRTITIEQRTQSREKGAR